MNIQNDKPVMIFRRDTEFGTFYNVGLSKKTKEGTYLNGYMVVQFRNGVEIENQTKIVIKKAWLSFFLKEKETKPYIFIADFEIYNEDPYEAMGQEIDDNDLPF